MTSFNNHRAFTSNPTVVCMHSLTGKTRSVYSAITGEWYMKININQCTSLHSRKTCWNISHIVLNYPFNILTGHDELSLTPNVIINRRKYMYSCKQGGPAVCMQAICFHYMPCPITLDLLLGNAHIFSIKAYDWTRLSQAILSIISSWRKPP